MSSSKCVIAVFGATGRQGSAVFHSLLKSHEFIVRAVTRNPQSESAKSLLSSVSAGDRLLVELVCGDLNDEKSLAKVFEGAWGAFVMTSPFDAHNYNNYYGNEEQQVKTAADQALKAGVKFFTFSSLPDADTISGGRHRVPHFTLKNKAEQYIRGLPFAEGVCFPYAGSFACNYLAFIAPKKNEKDGVYEFANIVRSDVAVPIVSLEDEFGPAVLEIFRHPKLYNQKDVLTGNYMTYPQLAECFSKGTGKPARYVQLPLEAGKNFGDAVNDMFQYFNNFGYYGGKNFEHIVKTTDAVAFFKQHAAQF